MYSLKNKIFWKFLSAYILLIVAAIFVFNFFVGLKLESYYEQKISDKLKSNALLVGELLASDILDNDVESIKKKTLSLGKKLNYRITVIKPNGKVIGDSKHNPETMENHSDRPEITKALKFEVTESKRFSDTLGYHMKYVALPLIRDKKVIVVIRIALSLEKIEQQMRFIYGIVLLGGLVTFFFAMIFGYLTSKKITNPIREMKEIAKSISIGNFSKRIAIKNKDELGDLGRSLNIMADDLETQISHLKKADQIRTDFVANVSHELKTPLTSIKGFVETLEHGALEDKENAQRFLAIIKKHANNLNHIVDDLLKLSELESNKDVLDRTNCDLKACIDEALLGFDHMIKTKKHDVKLEFQGSDFSLIADKTKIEQVFVNIIENAIKYTESGGLISIKLASENKHLKIAIEDNGIGIPKEHLNRVFERFYRVDKARSRKQGGTGLGLSIVKHIVLLHNGTVKIDSLPNQGTKVIISLPTNV